MGRREVNKIGSGGGIRRWCDSYTGNQLFIYLFVTLSNSLVTPGEQSLQFMYSNVSLPLIQRGINTLPNIIFPEITITFQ